MRTVKTPDRPTKMYNVITQQAHGFYTMLRLKVSCPLGRDLAVHREGVAKCLTSDLEVPGSILAKGVVQLMIVWRFTAPLHKAVHCHLIMVSI